MKWDQIGKARVCFLKFVVSLLTSVLVFLFSGQAHAQSCTTSGNTWWGSTPTPWDKSAVFIGRDMPTGFVISQGESIVTETGGQLTCTGTPGAAVATTSSSFSLAGDPQSPWNGGSFTAANGQSFPLYQIAPGLALGIGVYPSPIFLDDSGTWKTSATTPLVLHYAVHLVVTDRAALLPGTYISFPPPLVQANTTFGSNTSLGWLMAGWPPITIASGTCDTPDVTVPLGSHHANEFSGVGSGTGWTDFAITLQNCPAFRGPGSLGANASQTNAIGVVLTTATSVIGAPSNGTVALSTNPSGPTASGIGIQIAAAGTRTPLTIDGATINSVINPPISSPAGASYTIPLSARYIQTGALKGGQANGSLYFTINYQ